MSVFHDMAHDAGYRGDEAEQAARMLEEQEREHWEAKQAQRDAEIEADYLAHQSQHRLDRATELVYDHVDGSYDDLSRSRIRTVLRAAEAVFETEFDVDTVICHDCGRQATPACDVQGHGTSRLSELIESYSNPARSSHDSIRSSDGR